MIDKNIVKKQEPPFCIQIELTEGCNLMCSFCGVHGIRQSAGMYKFMTIDIAIKIVSLLQSSHGWNPRIEFAMHGEPTLNPNFVEIIKLFNTLNMPLMLCTNGAGLLIDTQNKIKRLFVNGLSTLTIDNYKNNKKNMDKILKMIDGKFPIFYYPKQNESPHTRKKYKRIIIVDDISNTKIGNHATLNNHCGCASKPLIFPLKKRCAKPFRELAIRWDGNVALCCNDWRGVYKCGNIVNYKSIEDLWQNKFFTAARKRLYYKMRDFSPCEICNATSYRMGLLPDKKGKEKINQPTLIPDKIINAAIKDEAYSPIILRQWEK